MSVPQKSIPSAVVYYYCAWYTFLRNRRYQEISSVFVLETPCEEFTIKVDKNQQNLHFALQEQLQQSQSASAGLESEIEQLVSEMGLEGSQSGNAKQG